jgi:hypothetical protein
LKNLKKSHSFGIFGSLIVIMFLGCIFTFSSCDYGLSPTEETSSEPPINGQIDFLMYSSGGYEPSSITHTIEVGQTFYVRARTNDSSIIVFTWTFGNGQTANGRDILSSYSNLGLFDICVTGWRGDSTYVTFCDQMNVVVSTTNANPVITVISSTALSALKYKFKLEYRKGASTDYTTCGWDTSRAAIYNTGTNRPWITHRHIMDTIANGNMRDTITASIGDTLKWAFGGSFSGGSICFANMAPNSTPPQTSRFWYQNGLRARVSYNGTLVPFDSVIAVPGSVGDDIIRLGVSPTNPDSIRFYPNGAYCSGTSGSYQWANNVTGLSVAKNLSDVPGYPGWKMGALHKDQIMGMINNLIKFKFGRPLSNLASYQGSILYNSDSGLLEVVVIDIGDSAHPKPVMQVKNRITGEIFGELAI